MGLAIETLEKYLIESKRRNVKQVLSYAQRYGYVLQTGDAKEISGLGGNKRRHVMEALAILSKSVGQYNRWKQIKEQYQLKWSNGDTDDFYIQYIDSILNGKQQLTEMINWLKETCSKVPRMYSDALVFNTLTGLRPTESYHSLELIHSDYHGYVKERDDSIVVLEHYKHPATFIRKTKKAYISIVTPDVVEFAKGIEPISWDALRSAINKRGLETHVKYCRKIFATYVRQQGIDTEIVDLLQGRVAKTVFARYYFRPDFDPTKITNATKSLYRLLKTR